MKRYRKWAFLTAFIFAAILTPTPDPFNQCLMALPMYIFYEVGIVSAGIFNKKSAATSEESLVPAVAPVGQAAAKPAPPVSSGGGEGDYVGVPMGGGRRG